MNPPLPPPPPLRSARIIWLEVAEFRIVSEAVGCARDRKRTWWEQPCEPLPPPPPGGLRGGALVLSDLGAGESVGAAEALGRGNAQTDDRVALFKVTSKLRVSIPALF